MPTLVDKIKQASQTVKRGNQLFDLVNESVTQQTQRLGMPVGAVVSPQAAAELGGTQDQAKMAGSSAQLQNVERLAVRPSFSQRQVEELKQPTGQQTAEQKQQAARAQQLGQFGERIGGIVKAASNRMIQEQADAQKKAAEAGKGIPTTINNDKWTALQLPEADKQKLEPALTAALDGTATQEQLATVASLLPGLSASSSAADIANEVNKYRQTETNAVTSNLQNVLPNQITVAQLSDNDIQALGFASRDAMAQTLGFNPDELNGKSIEDLQSTVDALQRQDYGLVKELQAAVNNPNLSQAARDEAMTALRSLGASGVRATEEDFAKLNDAVQTADTITIDGQEIKIGELLSDEGISAAISKYLTDPKYAEQLKAASPELAAFIEQNKNALTDAANKLSEGTKKLADTQAANAKLSKTDDGIQLSDDLNRVLYGDGWGKVSTSSYTPKNAYNILNNQAYDARFRTNYASILNKLAKSNPALAKQFGDYTYDQLKAAKLNTVEAMTAYANYMNSVQTFNSNPDPIQAVSGLFDNFDGLNEQIRKAINLAKSGIGTPVSSRILELFGNAPLDLNDRSPANLQRITEVYNRLKSFMGLDANGQPLTPVKADGSVNDLSGIPNPNSLANKLGEDVTTAERSNPVSQYLADGQIDATEIADLASQYTKSADLQSLYDQLSKGQALSSTGAWGMQSPAQTLKEAINTAAENEFSDLIKEAGLVMKTSADTPKLPATSQELDKLLSDVKARKTTAPLTVQAKFDGIIRTITNRLNELRRKEAPAPAAGGGGKTGGKMSGDRQRGRQME